MSQKPRISPSVGSLSVGDVVSGGLRIYRDRFKLYCSLAFRAYLWLFVPIYGWAKWSAISALIARLAYCEVSEQPESVSEARRHVDPQMWNLFLAGVLVNLILSGLMTAGFLIGIVIVLLLLGAVAIFAQGSPDVSAIGIGITVIFGLLFILVFSFAYLWLYSRLSVVELPISLEKNTDATTAIGRSWRLTQGSIFRIQLLFFAAFLITLPLTIIINVISSIAQFSFLEVFGESSGLYLLSYYTIVIILSIASGSVLVPFWQSIKAVLYYDLRTRREGLGLQLRDVSSLR